MSLIIESISISVSLLSLIMSVCTPLVLAFAYFIKHLKHSECCCCYKVDIEHSFSKNKDEK